MHATIKTKKKITLEQINKYSLFSNIIIDNEGIPLIVYIYDKSESKESLKIIINNRIKFKEINTNQSGYSIDRSLPEGKINVFPDVTSEILRDIQLFGKPYDKLSLPLLLVCHEMRYIKNRSGPLQSKL